MKRPDSRFAQFDKRIPADVRALAVGRTLAIPVGAETVLITVTPRMAAIRLSLRTSDPSEVQARQGQVCAYLAATWAALRSHRPVTLSRRQANALAGDLYRGWANEDRGRTLAMTLTAGQWVQDRSTADEEREAFAGQVAKLEGADPESLEPLLGPLVDRLLLRRGFASITAETRADLLDAFAMALRDAFASRARNADGDYSPDPKAARFPDWEPPSPSPEAAPKTSLTGLVDGWWAERKAAGLKPSTHESYRQSMAAFVAFLKHDDASRVTVEDVIAFKDHRLRTINPRTGKPISPKTVKDSDISGLKAIFGWAVANRRMATNPAKDVTLKLGKPLKVRSQGFTDDEARAILKAALTYRRGEQEMAQTAAAKRWVPWLAAYTGARVGELAQLRKQDLRREGAHWVIRITPEAGTVKTNEARDVVLHPHLVEQGFPEFVLAAPPGHLFLRLGVLGDVAGPRQGVKNRLAEFARAIVPDPNVAPNHGWRHRFKTVGIEAGIGERVLDAIQGHAPRTTGGSYGEVTVKAVAAGIERLPWIDCLR
ncbi:tyrosine-type recombinase/integrase [Methylobacterium aerolatum]|uniref:Integrase n=1 Tax=Methylobacterium aerolatum TaxID=418708 RepID=A0ABU0I353_9HYPH|nr:tyrosine-type recombinase/integrase [Methylobacterium aerolatum]MDQ0448136.1 integrase [Methylobacterium aerolatum]